MFDQAVLLDLLDGDREAAAEITAEFLDGRAAAGRGASTRLWPTGDADARPARRRTRSRAPRPTSAPRPCARWPHRAELGLRGRRPAGGRRARRGAWTRSSRGLQEALGEKGERVVRILIAEDDVTSRMLLTRVLENWGYEVTATKDGAEAWEALQAQDAPRLAILDWMMPEHGRRGRMPPGPRPGDAAAAVHHPAHRARRQGERGHRPGGRRRRLRGQAVRSRTSCAPAWRSAAAWSSSTTSLLEAQHALEILARTDALTGVLNRGAIVERTRAGDRAGDAGRERGSASGCSTSTTSSSSTTRTATRAGDAVLCEVVRRVLRRHAALRHLRPLRRRGVPRARARTGGGGLERRAGAHARRDRIHADRRGRARAHRHGEPRRRDA